MIKKDLSEVDVDEIMKRIRTEVEKRKSRSGNKAEASADSEQQYGSSLSDPLQNKGTTATSNATLSEVGNEYSIKELCQYNDIDFIKNAYRVILFREPDLDEVNIWLSKFRTGVLTKKEILALLRFGSEGRGKKVVIRGLFVPFILHRLFNVPIFGRFLRTMGCIVHLPILFRNIQGLEYSVTSRIDSLNIHIDEFEKTVQVVQATLSQKANWTHLSRLNESLQGIDSRLQETNSRLGAMLQKTDGRIHEATRGFQESLERVNTELADVIRKARDSKFNILAQQRRLDDLFQQGQIPRAEATRQVQSKRTDEDHVLDAMYVAFEDRFRGTREDIKERQSIYLPYVEKVQQTTAGGVILDAGCGRGEWLELLAKEGYSAKGVDLNRMMVTQSRELSLDVEEGDVFDHFSDMAPDNLSVVTGFHIVEHLPLKTMIALFDQAYRVLKPGGMVIFETPNPENIIVGSCSFYYDPTHRNPIPPEALSFLLEARGYQNIEIVRLHENVEYADLKETNISEKITSRFWGPQDYAVIGYKV